MCPKVMLFLILCVLPLATARCPRPSGLPALYSKDKFMCARLYLGAHRVSSRSCTGKTLDIPNEMDALGLVSPYNQISALVLRPGCTMQAFDHSLQRGREKTFSGTNSYLRRQGWDNRIQSFSCQCEVRNKALTCKPTEEYRRLTGCRNVRRRGTMTCTVGVTKGMEIGTSNTFGKSVSTTISSEVGLSIKGIFSASLSVSHTTSYDWSRTDSKTFSKSTTKTAHCDMEPGDAVEIFTVVGKCGATTIYTGYYECRDMKTKRG